MSMDCISLRPMGKLCRSSLHMQRNLLGAVTSDVSPVTEQVSLQNALDTTSQACCVSGIHKVLSLPMHKEEASNAVSNQV